MYPIVNFHVTLVFVGEIPDAALELLKTIGSRSANHAPALALIPTNFFVKDDRLRLAIERTHLLLELRNHLVNELRHHGFALKERPEYEPHITLGRPEPGFDLAAFTLKPSHYTFRAHEFVLFKSEQGGNNMGVYTPLASFSLR